jgi:hypothetical protein
MWIFFLVQKRQNLYYKLFFFIFKVSTEFIIWTLSIFRTHEKKYENFDPLGP